MLFETPLTQGTLVMAHEISVIEENGVEIVEAAYANTPAWHNLGNVFNAGGTEAPDSETMMELAHQNWLCEKEQMNLVQDGKPVGGGYFATVRQDTREVLGIVGKNYKVLQNKDAFKFMDSFMQDGIMRYESAMALFGGRQVVLLARMPSVDEIIPGDRQERYLLLSNTHDGTGSIIMQPTHVRVVCNNTHRIAIANETYQVKVRHSSSMEEKMEMARKYLSQFDKKFSEYTETAKHLAKVSYTDDMVSDYLNQLFPAKADASERQVKNRLDKLMMVKGMMNTPGNTLPGMEGTMWQLFNAVTEAVDHRSSYKGDDLSRAENRFTNIMEGAGAALKDKAFELALQMAV